MRVRIRQTPNEEEVDGVKLDRLVKGQVCEVSPSIGSWLLAKGYAELEMRAAFTQNGRPDAERARDSAHDRRRKPR